jgi:hypothetical protein
MAKTDERTLQLIQEVAKQKEEISRAERPNWATNCSFKFVEGGPSINLHVESDLRVLIEIYAHIERVEESYYKAVEQLGLRDYPAFSWGGFTASDWLKDVKSRISKIQISAKRKKLEALESRLNTIISPELRAELELEAISAQLK